MATENPLRILVITSRPLTDPAGNPITLLDVAEERRRIRDALKNAHIAVDVQFVPEGTTQSVKAALRAPRDIIHITAHGTADGHLVIENNVGEAHLLSKQETAQLFAENTAPLIFISACYSEIIARDLHAAGAPTLVAIDSQRPIEDHAAILFAEQFYDGLVRGWTFERAFNDAQRAIAIDPDVGDKNPPLDEQGKPEKPWSQRFILLGIGSATLHATTGEYRETDTREHITGNLRERNANFVGRAKEIVEIVKAFDDRRGVRLNAQQRVAITGAGGMGKTALSRAVAWWFVERGRVDAVLWASASRDEGEYILRDLASLLSIAARAFKLSITEQTKFDEQKAVVREFLDKNRALVILDNWETIEPRPRKELWDFIQSLSDRVRVVVTSRDVLPAKDARNIELDTLTLQDAAKLFIGIARNAGYFDRNPRLSGEEVAILHQIIGRLGGYPLAVEVVAGQTESRSLSEIWNDLVRIPKNVLEGKDEITGEPRGVWTSLGFSYDVLPDAEKAMFRQMGVFLAPAMLEDIAAITQVENPRVTLDTLVRRSLVRFREGTYALLPTVRDYAESRLEDAGQDPQELHVRALQYFDSQKTIEGRLTASEHLFQLAARFQSRQAAEASVNYVKGFYQDLVTRGYWSEARYKTEQLIAVARALEDKATEAQYIGELGTRYQQIGDYERAAALHKQAQKLMAEGGDKRGQAVALHQMGMLAQDQGNYPEAVRLYRESMKLEEELGNKRGIASTLHNLAAIEQAQGNYAEAVRLYGESLKLEEELGNKRGIASTLGQLGQLARAQGQMKEALGYFVRAFAIFEKLHSPYRELARQLIGEIRNEAGDEQFAAWVSTDADAKRISGLLEEGARSEKEEREARRKEFVQVMVENANVVLNARLNGTKEEQDETARQLVEAEKNAREDDDNEVADYYAVLRGLLMGEDVTEKIAGLVEPLKRIAEQASQRIASQNG